MQLSLCKQKQIDNVLNLNLGQNTIYGVKNTKINFLNKIKNNNKRITPSQVSTRTQYLFKLIKQNLTEESSLRFK